MGGLSSTFVVGFTGASFCDDSSASAGSFVVVESLRRRTVLLDAVDTMAGEGS